MVDVHTPDQRSYNMSKIRGKNTKPEITLRKKLWKLGYRYRLHKKGLPGSPDIVFSKYKSVIFVHGCYWHRHGCKYTTTPATRSEFWESKFQKNIERDLRNIQNLTNSGWRVMVVWECEIKKDFNNKLIRKIQNFLDNKISEN